jgi:hypothetical protein
MMIFPWKDGGCLLRCLLSWISTPKICIMAADCWSFLQIRLRRIRGA